ncbi:hypothetical protein MBANPS3_005945 [Mucor bainieri]
MAGNVIGTSSYSEAMDLSDLEEDGYNEDMYQSPETSPTMNTMEQQQQHQQAQQQQQPGSQQQQEPPVKVRKKPGRKPNPASPALRKAQNRAAQRAFRERKERHMKDLESNIKGIKDHRDRLLQENEKMSSENEILKAENWYLKGIVLSLQLVCLQHNLVIPQHCPHVNDETLSVLAQSIPESISSYLNVNSRNKLQISQKLMNESPELSNLHLQSQPPQPPYTQQPQQQQQQQQQQPFPHQFPSGSIIITQDGVHKVPNKHGNGSPHQQHHGSSWYHQQTSASGAPSSQPQHPYSSSSNSSSGNNMYGSPNSAHTADEFSNIPPLSPMSSSTMTDRSENAGRSSFGAESSRELPRPHIIAAPSEPITSNLAAIQTLRLRLRLQSACVRMQSMPFAIQPTLLQLTIPHDPRIDLIPTPHMRDRMILYRDQFDLDDCFRSLLSGSVFHGGDPAVAGNWQLPEEFFKKYWFLTIDYNLRRYTNEWRKKQGLKEINGNIPTLEDAPQQQQQQQQQQQSPVNTSAPSQFTPPLTMPVPPPQHMQSNMYAPPPPPPLDRRSMTYDDLSSYLGMQLDGPRASPPATSTSTTSSTNVAPVQLTNGYGGMMGSTLQPQPKPQSAWESLIGSRNYDMMMTGSYSKNDMDQGPN